MRLQFLRALFGIAFVTTCIATQRAEAQSPPTDSYCYGTACFPTKAGAESVMRLDPKFLGAGQFLLQTSASVDNPSTGATKFSYRVAAQPASTVSEPQFDAVAGVFGNGAFGCNLAPGQSNWCGDEESLIVALVKSIEESLSMPTDACKVNDPSVTSAYPVQGYVRSAGSGLAVIDFGESGYRGSWQCNAKAGSVAFSIRKRYLAQCPAGFSPTSVFVTEQSLSSARICVANTTQSGLVTGPMRQVASCKASPNPCHPTTGDKSRDEVDFYFAGRPFSRHYHSTNQIQQGMKFAVGWSHSYLDRVENKFTYFPYWNSDGTFENFSAPPSSANVVVGQNSRDTIIRAVSDGTVRYKLYLPGGDVKNFDSQGRLVSVVNPQRPEDDVTVSYSNDLISKLTDKKGRAVSFVYQAGRLVELVKPDGTSVRYTYDSESNLASVDYGGEVIRRYHYAEPAWVDPLYKNHLTGISAEDGTRYASFGYDAYGRVTSSQLHVSGGYADGVQVNYTSPSTSTLTTANGEVRTFSVDSTLYRRVTGVEDGSGTTAFTLDGQGRVASLTDESGGITSFVHHPLYVAEIHEAVGTLDERRTSFERNAENQLLTKRVFQHSGGGSTQGLLQQMVTWSYNARGQLTVENVHDLAGISTQSQTLKYCEQADVDAMVCPLVGLLISTDGPRTDVADVTVFTYRMADASGCETTTTTCDYRKGDLWKVTNALGHITETLRYDGAGRPLSILDHNGVVTDLEYHPRGWLAAHKVRGADDSVESDDRIFRFDYWPNGQIRRVTQPDGAWTDYDYDAAQRLIAIHDNAGNAIDYILDPAGNPLTEHTSDSSGTLRKTLSRLYDQLGREVTRADASANPTDFSFDTNSNITAVTDALGRVTSNTYDSLNRLVQTMQDVDGIKASTTLQYDTLDQVTRVVDPNGLATEYAYSSLGRLLQLDSTDTGTTTYSYDSGGNRTGQVDARGQAAHYSYDSLNRLTGIQHPGAADLEVSYVYDVTQPACQAGETYAVGQLSAMVDASGSTNYCYDRFGDVVRKVQATNGQIFSLGYTYTTGGQLSTLTYPDGTAADYVRDAQGRIIEIGVTAPGGTRDVLLADATHAPFGPAAGWTYGNGRSLLRSYDLDYRPQAIHDPASGGLNLGYEYDPTGEIDILRIADPNGPPRARFDHDALGRLIAFRDGATGTAIETYTYDATGNRTSFTNAAGLQAYDYPVDSHRLIAVGGQARTYDAVGNMLTDGSGRSYVYSAANRLTRVEQGGSAKRHYVYNGKGERVRSYLGADDVTTLYDEAGRWLGDYALDGTPKQQAIWLDNLPVGLLAQDATNPLLYIQPDHLGTPRALIDPVRNVAVWTWDLASEAFGNSPPHQDPDGDGTGFVFDLRFPGQRYDAASGLNYNYFRDYDQAVGRYVQSDPIGLEGGPNTYAYVGGNPVNWIDPLGLQAGAPTIPYVPASPWWGSLPRLLGLGSGPAGVIVGSLLPTDMGYSSCEMMGPGACGRIYNDSTKPDNCPTGTLPIDKAKGKFGLDKDAVHGIKTGVGAGPRTWTGIDPNGNVWTGGPGGVGENHGPFGDYLPGG